MNDPHHVSLSEALAALADRWVSLDGDGRRDATYTVISRLAQPSIIAALALHTAIGRLLRSHSPTDPDFLENLSADARSDLTSRLDLLRAFASRIDPV